jgi:hypothetical protein
MEAAARGFRAFFVLGSIQSRFAPPAAQEADGAAAED